MGRTLTKADVQHIKSALRTLRDIIETYPEIVTQRSEDTLLVAEEIMRENTGS